VQFRESSSVRSLCVDHDTTPILAINLPYVDDERMSSTDWARCVLVNKRPMSLLASRSALS
jgi:hypothetical protein